MTILEIFIAISLSAAGIIFNYTIIKEKEDMKNNKKNNDDNKT